MDNNQIKDLLDINTLRRELKMSKKTLSLILGVSQHTLIAWQKKRSKPSLSNALQISDFANFMESKHTALAIIANKSKNPTKLNNSYMHMKILLDNYCRVNRLDIRAVKSILETDLEHSNSLEGVFNDLERHRNSIENLIVVSDIVIPQDLVMDAQCIGITAIHYISSKGFYTEYL